MVINNIGEAVLHVLVGGWDMSLEILLIIMVLDYITGVIRAFRSKSVNSSTGYKGLIKKSTILIIIILAAQVDRMLGTDNHIFRNCTALSFTVNDALSILENIGMMGVRFPKFLMVALEKLQERIEALPEQNSLPIDHNDELSSKQSPNTSEMPCGNKKTKASK